MVTDQVFPSVEIEREILAGIGARLEVADGTIDGAVRSGHDADALLNTYMPVDAAFLSRLSRCRIIARYGIGVDNVDVDAAERAGMFVTNVPDYSLEEVAVHTVGLMLAMVRRLSVADALVRGGIWGIGGVRPIHRLSTMTVGLVGFGRIARRVARSVEALGVRIVAHDPFLPTTEDLPTMLSLDDLVERSDIISLHVPLTAETRDLFGAERIARMRPGAMLINTSRGPLVDFDALADGLRSGHLSGAALDVFPTEPFEPGRLRDVPNLISTPHMAYYSEESIQESQRKAATQIAKVLSGKDPVYVVGRPRPGEIAHEQEVAS